jgi:thioredoxin reductase (NADPH)
MDEFRGKNVLIAGGGDSALDWTLNLAPVAKRLTLVHHRDGIPGRAAQRQPHARAGERGQDRLPRRERENLARHDGRLEAVTLASPDKKEWVHEANTLLPFFGLTIKLGPIADFGTEPARKPDPGGHREIRELDARDLRHRRHQHLSGKAEAHPLRLP